MAFLIRFVLIPLIAILLIRYILRSLGTAGRSGRIMSDETGFACTLFAALGHIAEGRSVMPRERLVRRILGIIAAAVRFSCMPWHQSSSERCGAGAGRGGSRMSRGRLASACARRR